MFEGIDGAGKTTQIELLEKSLQAIGRRVYRTAEPTESVTGGLLRDALGGITKRTACEMAALFTLDRIFHNVNPVNGIEKMLADGVDVICDRYYYSCLANLRARGFKKDRWIYEIAESILKPDLAFFFDVPVETAVARVRSRPEEKDRRRCQGPVPAHRPHLQPQLLLLLCQPG